ncbi:MAG: hypothetical protein RBU45_13390 [Myxococcota bacterium]|jgi:hypothetical protein|nr:hypothetical protein [Myxococcota bacterium]
MPEPPRSGRARRLLGWTLPLLGVAIAWRNLPDHELVRDARLLIAENSFLRRLADLPGNLLHDYFWSSAGSSIPYWRPWTKASWLLEYLLFAGEPGGFHLVQLGWLLLIVIGVRRLTRLLGGGPGEALAAGLLCGFHPATLEPTGLVMARSDLVAAAGAVFTLGFWLQWRQDGGRRWLGLHLAALLLALGSKETAVVLAPLLWLWSGLFSPAAPPPPRAAAGRVWPALVTGALPATVLVAGWLALRRIVLGPLPALVAPGDGWRWLVGGGRYLLGLAPGRLETGIRNLSLAEAHAPATWIPALLAWLVVLLLIGGAWWVRRAAAGLPLPARLTPGAPPPTRAARTATATLALLLWGLASLLPVLLVPELHVPNVAGKIPLADRWALQAALASAALLPLLARHLGPRPRRLLGLALAGWVGASLLLATELRAPYASELALLELEDRRLAETPAPYRTEADRCRLATRSLVRAGLQGQDEELLQRFAALSPTCQARPENRFNQLAALVRLGRTAEAVPLVPGLLHAIPPASRDRAPLLQLGGQALLAEGSPAAAVELLEEARRLGLPDCGLRLHLGRALALTGQLDQAAGRFEEGADCLQARGEPVPPLVRLAAAQAWLAAGQPRRAQPHLAWVEAQPDLAPAEQELLRSLRAQ